MTLATIFLRMTALVPIPFLAMATFGSGLGGMAALVYLSLFAFLADESMFASTQGGDQKSPASAAFAEIVPIILGTTHLILLPAAVHVLARGELTLAEQAAIFLAFMLFFGTISTANAHELIHRHDRLRHTLGKWVFTSLLFGHHTSAHLLVHHRWSATPLDPNTARLNEGAYHFLGRAWIGSAKQGFRAEKRRLAIAGRRPVSLMNPYWTYGLGGLVFLGYAWAIGGWSGIFWYMALAMFAQSQLLLSDYVQHYGLRRRRLGGDRFERVSLQHSWNAPHVFSSSLMMNAPRHSDHHTHPMTPYHDLRVRASEGAPLLPYSIPVMSVLALVPPIWRRVMNPAVADWNRRQEEPAKA